MAVVPRYDPQCYLCPGNARAGGAVNPAYSATFVFTNDYAALSPVTEIDRAPPDDNLLVAEAEGGVCRVLCYSPRHDLTLARMEPSMVAGIVACWQQEYRDLGAHPQIDHVQIFENRGLVMGCSNPHPHGQVWANSTIPTLPAREDREQHAYLQRTGRCLLCDYLETEFRLSERVLFVNPSFVALVPFWAVWPFETMILPRRHSPSILAMTAAESRDLAEIMIQLGICYDNLFQTSFPYSMGIHQRPTDGCQRQWWHWHIHYLPPLLRSRSIRKHMVGYELLAMPQRDLTAERSAEWLRALPTSHYLDGRL